MDETVYLLNMFPDYQPPEPLLGMLSQAAITAADIDPETRSVTVSFSTNTYIPQRLLGKATREIAAAYGLRRLTMEPVYPADQLQCMEPDDLMQLFVSENSMTRGSLAGAKWTWQDCTLTIDLVANGVRGIHLYTMNRPDIAGQIVDNLSHIIKAG